MEYKSFDFKITNLEELTEGEWVVEGYASTWTTDNGNDRLVRGAFLDSYKERFLDQKAKNGKSKIKILWQHDPADIIGQLIEAREDDQGLFIRLKLIKHPLFINAEKAYILAKLGEMDSFSIGYKKLKWKKVMEDGVEITELIKVKWYEVSFVTFPMNELAEFTSVKEEDDEEMNEEILEAVKQLGEQMSLVLKTMAEPKELAVEVKAEEVAPVEVVEEKVAIEVKLDASNLKEVLDTYRNEILTEVKSLLSGLEEKSAMKCKDCGAMVECKACKPAKEDPVMEAIGLEDCANEKAEEVIVPEELVIEAPVVEEIKSNPEKTEEDILEYLLNKDFKF